MEKERNLPELLEEISTQETGHPDTQKRAIMAFMDLIVIVITGHFFGVKQKRPPD